MAARVLQHLQPRATDDTVPDVLSAIQNATLPYTRGLTGTNQSGNFFFTDAIIIFFCVLLGVTLIGRLYKLLTDHMRHLSGVGFCRQQQTLFMNDEQSIWQWVKRYYLYAPLWKKRHNKEIQISSAVSIGTLPSRLHFLLLAVYFCSNVAYCAVLDYSQPKAATIAELRGRAGALAAINLIPTVLFALRNNPLIPILKVSYDTFNLLHRWAARIVLLETSLHVLAWIINDIDAGSFSHLGKVFVQSAFMGWGLCAAIVFFVMCFLAWSPIRHAFYETFLVLHRAFAGLAIAGVYVHLAVASLPGRPYLPQLPYIWVVLIFWGCEYVIRIGRIVFYNFWSRKFKTQVRVEAMPGDACRVTFDLVRHWSFKPGSHVHVYLPRISYWSSHPFSVAWARDFKPSLLDADDKETLPSTVQDLDAKTPVRTSVSLVMRARTGMTRKLYDRASKAPNGIISLSGFIEGPYGGHESLDSYGTVLLFAAGVGITHHIGYVHHLVKGYSMGTVATRKVILVWSVPNTECLEWVRPWMDEILRIEGRRDVLTIRLYVTKPKSQQEILSGTGTVQMLPGRCNPQAELDREFLDRIGAMCVNVCGNGAFADAARGATRKRVQLGTLDFIEEAFTY